MVLSLANCGYQPIYSKKNILDLPIREINLMGNKNIGRQIIPLLNLNTQNGKDSKYSLQLTSDTKVQTVAKNRSGTASVYNTTMNVILTLHEGEQKIKEKTFNQSFTYNNIKNKFDLSQYQRDIKKNLINKISNEILVFLSTE